MSNKPLNISEEAAVQMPMKTVASLIIIVALGTMGYFQIVERLNIADTKLELMNADVEQNTEFRIKWPRGQMGSLPADSEQYMMLEDLYKTTERINKHKQGYHRFNHNTLPLFSPSFTTYFCVPCLPVSTSFFRSFTNLICFVCLFISAM